MNTDDSWTPSAERLQQEVLAHRQRAEQARIERERKTAEPVLTVDTVSEPRICGTCGATFEARVLMMDGRPMVAAQHCERCVQRHLEQERESALGIDRSHLVEAWEEICPELYRDTDLAILRKSLGAKVDQVLSTPIDRGLILFGPTGTGKTRLMFELLRRYHFDGVDVMAVNAATFADKLAAQYADGAGAAERWMMKHIRVTVLALDDLGKEALQSGTRRMSERAETALYRLLEERHAHHRKLWVTTNKTTRELLERMSEDRGLPMMRRLKAMSEPIALL